MNCDMINNIDGCDDVADETNSGSHNFINSNLVNLNNVSNFAYPNNLINSPYTYLDNVDNLNNLNNTGSIPSNENEWPVNLSDMRVHRYLENIHLCL